MSFNEHEQIMAQAWVNLKTNEKHVSYRHDIAVSHLRTLETQLKDILAGQDKRARPSD